MLFETNVHRLCTRINKFLECENCMIRKYCYYSYFAPGDVKVTYVSYATNIILKKCWCTYV